MCTQEEEYYLPMVLFMKRSQLLKVHDSIVGSKSKNVIQNVNNEHKTELVLKREDMKETNTSVGTRERKRNRKYD